MSTVSQELQPSKGRCAVCQRELDPPLDNLDHIIPVAAGGTDEINNLRLVCSRCNVNLFTKLLEVASNPSTEVAKLWIRAFDKTPWITGAATVATGAVTALIAYTTANPQIDDQAKSIQPIPEQIQQLDATQDSLSKLSEFVTAQRQQILHEQAALARLRIEKSTLEPVVSAQRQSLRPKRRAPRRLLPMSAGSASGWEF